MTFFSVWGAAAGGDVSPYMMTITGATTIDSHALNLATDAVGLNSHVVHISKRLVTTGGLCNVVGPTRHVILSKYLNVMVATGKHLNFVGMNVSPVKRDPHHKNAGGSPLRHHVTMLGLTDAQLKIIMTAANAVPVERRSIFLERVGAMLKVRGRFTDADVSDVAKLAMAGLVRTEAA